MQVRQPSTDLLGGQYRRLTLADGSILLMPADVAPRRRAVGPDHAEVIADEIVDLRDRMKSDDSPKKSSWWEQRREQQRQNARGQ